MSRKLLLVAGVLLAGVAVACWVGIGFFGMKPGHDEDGLMLALMAAFFGGFPALLVLLPNRIALAILVGIAALLGLWGISVFNLPGDGAIGGFILLFADVVFLLFGLAVIGLRALLIKNLEA
ncbi:MAG: hypothetical protein ACKO1O_14340 [Erythrobacter sp.]